MISAVAEMYEIHPQTLRTVRARGAAAAVPVAMGIRGCIRTRTWSGWSSF